MYPYPGLAEPVGSAEGPGKEVAKPDDDDAPGEGRWRVVAKGVDQESMWRNRGEARLAADESRLVILRAQI